MGRLSGMSNGMYKWDNKISQMSCDIDALKYLHKDEWVNLPSRATIKNAI